MNVISRDTTTLPTEALDMVKAWSRVEHNRDDLLITDMAAQAIDFVEKTSNVNLFAATYAFNGNELRAYARNYWLHDYCLDAAHAHFALPINNVRSFTALQDTTDVSADYQIEQAELGGTATAYLVGPFVSSFLGYVFTFDVGVELMQDMVPALRTRVMRRAASLYENREDSTALSADDQAGERFTTWRPDL